MKKPTIKARNIKEMKKMIKNMITKAEKNIEQEKQKDEPSDHKLGLEAGIIIGHKLTLDLLAELQSIEETTNGKV